MDNYNRKIKKVNNKIKKINFNINKVNFLILSKKIIRKIFRIIKSFIFSPLPFNTNYSKSETILISTALSPGFIPELLIKFSKDSFSLLETSLIVSDLISTNIELPSDVILQELAPKDSAIDWLIESSLMALSFSIFSSFVSS